MRFGVIGSGSWATALAKIITDKKQPVNWWVRNAETIAFFMKKSHNPHYLSSARFDTSLLHLSTDVREVVRNSDVLVIAIPSAYAASSLAGLATEDWKGKKVISAIKGLLPEKNILLNYYMQQEFGLGLEDYFAVLGPCHAEEVAEEKLSYLTFSGIDTTTAARMAEHFRTDYINTVVNHDILGVQYAAVLKNIYALGAGIAHGLDYGDNFLSVYIANAADEMAVFLRQFGAEHITVGEHEGEDPLTHRKTPNYAASVYLGDLLVTCYSLHSRNRRFGNMIGRGYTVKSAELEMNMVAEGYNAARCIHLINQSLQAPIPIAETIYKILWEEVKAAEGFKNIEEVLV
ncbi:MAG TPA: NAD(P)-binding domain-containing protein [Chitinophagaceae bacterium]|nr:NAD(P)-binding domain-containing protein [Chitinophagaceae bacterium]HPH32275.1 NAD(P)-binding domain-containing protein [Chitinophagaceae bacterium]HPN58477.1 NAD(P)-binding domain-containing protein [Chitinophagaceae bacterium]